MGNSLIIALMVYCLVACPRKVRRQLRLLALIYQLAIAL